MERSVTLCQTSIDFANVNHTKRRSDAVTVIL